MLEGPALGALVTYGVLKKDSFYELQFNRLADCITQSNSGFKVPFLTWLIWKMDFPLK